MKTYRRMISFLSFILLFTLVIGCGKKESGNQSQQQSGQTESSGDSKNPLEQMAKAAEDMTKSMSGDSKPVPPVSYKTLQTFLPTSYNDMKTEGSEGETASYGEWTFSQAKIRFDGENGSNAQIEILDYAHISLLYAPFRMFFNMKMARESSRGYEKSQKFGDHPGFVKWENDSKHGEITVLVGDRFILKIETYDLPEDAAQDILSKIDMGKLATTTAS